MELNAYIHSNSAIACACLRNWTITFSVRFIDRPEQRISLDDLTGFLLESQKVTLSRYVSSSLQNFPLQCPLNPCLCINPGNVGHGQQQGPGIHVQLPERPPERSRAALFPPRWGTRPLRTLSTYFSSFYTMFWWKKCIPVFCESCFPMNPSCIVGICGRCLEIDMDCHSLGQKPPPPTQRGRRGCCAEWELCRNRGMLFVVIIELWLAKHKRKLVRMSLQQMLLFFCAPSHIVLDCRFQAWDKWKVFESKPFCSFCQQNVTTLLAQPEEIMTVVPIKLVVQQQVDSKYEVRVS